jgi:hypothetical protein
MTRQGALALGAEYWRQVERSTRRLVRAVPSGEGTALRLVGRGPALLRFGRPVARLSPRTVGCAYPILGGLLARGAGGSISFEQRAHEAGWTLHVEVADFDPRLAAGPGRPAWTGLLYLFVQAPLHEWIARRHGAAVSAVSE